MKKTNKGYLVPLLIIVIAVLAVGWWLTAREEISEDTEIESTENTVSTKTESAAPVQKTAESQPTAATKSPVISWSFPSIDVVKPESHGTYKVLLTIDGKVHDINFADSSCGKTVPKSELLPGQLSAARCDNGDNVFEFAVHKAESGYIVTQASHLFVTNHTAATGTAWRQNTKVILEIK